MFRALVCRKTGMKTKGVRRGHAQTAKEGEKCEEQKKEKTDRQSGRVRRRKHKSAALLGWMLTPVRDY